MKQSYIVTLDLPRGATPADGLRYIRSAVAEYHGCLEPPHEDLAGAADGAGGLAGDPMFMLKRSTVRYAPKRVR
jgi:hypothetical protein